MIIISYKRKKNVKEYEETSHIPTTSHIFATTLHTTPQVQIHLNTKSQGVSFEKNVLVTKNNTPSLPLYDAHLEGFFISNIF